MDYNKCCRSCIQPISDKVNLLTDIKVRNLYEDCTRITVNNEDTLPKYLCFICYGQCNKWKEFQEECKQNEEFLKNWSLEEKLTLKTEIEFLNVDIKVESESDDERFDLLPTHNANSGNDESDSEDSKLKSIILNTSCKVKLEDIGKSSKVVIDDELTKIEVIPKRIKKKANLNDTKILAPKRVFVTKYTDLSKLNVSNKRNYTEWIEDESEPVTKKLTTEKNKPDAPNADTTIIKESSKACNSETESLNSENITKEKLLPARKATKRVYCEEGESDDERDNNLGRKNIQPKSVFECKICSKLFSRFEVCELHYLCIHMEIEPFECQICYAKYAYSHKLDDHLQRKHVPTIISPQHICSTCEQVFETEFKLKKHSKVHIVHPCEKCGKNYTKRYLLLGHIASAHSNKEKIKKPCPHCKKTFMHKASLDTHIKQYHLKDLRFICNVCGKLFATNSKLNSHIMTHSEERPYICTICSGTFKKKNRLDVHMTLHTGERPFKCPHCEKSFRQNSVLKNHSMTHTGERPHVCTICSRGFIQRIALTKHMESHR